jgi:hypothetical protein
MKIPKKRIDLAYIGLFVYWIVLLGIVGPFLISAADDLLLLGGVVLVLASAYFTYRIIINKAKGIYDAYQDRTGSTGSSGSDGVQ